MLALHGPCHHKGVPEEGGVRGVQGCRVPAPPKEYESRNICRTNCFFLQSADSLILLQARLRCRVHRISSRTAIDTPSGLARYNKPLTTARVDVHLQLPLQHFPMGAILTPHPQLWQSFGSHNAQNAIFDPTIPATLVGQTQRHRP